MLTKTKMLLAATALVAVTAGPANAVVITQAFHLSATFASGSPNPVTGDFSITFDNASDIIRQTTGITLTNFNQTYTGTLGFSYSKASDFLFIGSTTFPNSCSFNGGAFCLRLSDASTATPTSGLFGNVDGRLTFSNIQITPLATNVVPEPATWALLMLGFGGMGYAMRRRPSVHTRIRFA